MTAPTAAAPELVEHKADLRAPDAAPAGPVDSAAPLGGLSAGARGSSLVARLDHLTPANVLGVQRAAGNAAVAGLIQRAPETTKVLTEVQPTTASVLKPVEEEPEEVVPKKGTSTPVVPRGPLISVVAQVPSLVQTINEALIKYADNMQRRHGKFSWSSKEVVPIGNVSAVTLFAQDVVYRMDGAGELGEVESNFKTEPDPSKPNELPPPKYPLDAPGVYVMHPATRELFQLRIRFLSDPDERGSVKTKMKLDAISLTEIPAEIPTGMAPGEFIVLIYAPKNNAAKEGAMIPVKSTMNLGDAATDAPKDVPKWAKSQVSRVEKLIAQAQTAPEPAGEEGTGAGLEGTGAGGGGESAAPVVGGQAGKKGVPPDKGKGAGRSRQKRRAKPDRLVPWPSKDGKPMLNVWKNGTPTAIPLKAGEKDEELKQRIEEAAGKKESTGKSLADGATEVGIVGGEGGARPTAEQMAEATDFTANAAEYPSSIKMLGGSGAEVSPAGWATTITGATHNFDMILDYDARNFGLANQTFARLGWIDYFWQVIDVSKLPEFKAAKEQKQSDDEFQRQNRMAAATTAKQDPSAVDEAGGFEGKGAKLSRELTNIGEGVAADNPDILELDTLVTWPFKAGQLAIIGVSALWDIGKALLSAWFQSVTEPENRREIEFGKPGEYLVRCLANPKPDESKPYDEQTRRATSVAVFAVRVVDSNARARQMTSRDVNELQQAQVLYDALNAELKNDPKNKAKQTAVLLAERAVRKAKAIYSSDTSGKLKFELEEFDRQLPVLEKLARRSEIETLDGTDLLIGYEIRDDVQKRTNRRATDYVPWYDYEMYLHDFKEARKKKAEQKTQADERADEMESGSLRPRVAFVSEENGAVIPMDIMLGRAKGSTTSKPKWVLADVTTNETARSYEGSSSKAGTEGDAEAITKAFEEYCEKAEYGRGTISIDIRGRPDLMSPNRTMLMKPGSWERWKHRLQNLIEIAGLISPLGAGTRAGKLLGYVASIGGAIDAGARLVDKGVNHRLKANFETISDIVNVLGPLGQAFQPLSGSKYLKASKVGLVLRYGAEGIDFANELIMPATFVHDLDKLMKDTKMDPADKEAAIAMLFARGFRDRLVKHVKPLPGGGGGGAPSPKVGGRHVGGEGGVPIEAPAPARAELPGLPPRREGGSTLLPPTGGGDAPAPRTDGADVDSKFDSSETKRPLAADVDRKAAGSARAEQQTKAAPSRPVSGGDSEVTAVGKRPKADEGDAQPRTRQEKPDDRAADEFNTETMRREQGIDENARARAAEYVPLYNKWQQLGEAGRKAHVEGQINAYLAREGVPPVIIEWANLGGPAAQFDHNSWTLTLGKDAIAADKITSTDFGALVEHSVHETQHSVTTFRGIRAALDSGSYRPEVYIPGSIVALAMEANRRKPARDEFGEPTYKEALEIYRTQIEPPIHGPVQRGEVNREAVLTRMEETQKEQVNARRRRDEALRDFAKDDQNDTLRRQADDMEAAYQAAEAAFREAHNDYAGGTEEIAPWRKGIGAGKAAMEAIALQSRMKDAEATAKTQKDASDKARKNADPIGARVAAKKASEARDVADQAKKDLAKLAPSTEPQLQGGNVIKRGVPLTEKQIKNAPKAPKKGYLQPGEYERKQADSDREGDSERARISGTAGVGGAGAGGSSPQRPAPSVPTRPPDATKVSDFDPELAGKPQATVVSDQAPVAQKWRGKEVGSDLTSGKVEPSVGTGVVYDVRDGRYKFTDEKPTEGMGAASSYIVTDRDGQKYLLKPVDAERDIDFASERGVEKGQIAPRAKASEIAAREVGIDTPGVELVSIDGVRGSLTKWVEKATPDGGTSMSLTDHLRPTKQTTDTQASERMKELWKDPDFRDAWNNIQALDHLINNLDRLHNYGNYLIEFDAAGKFARLRPIDSELSYTTTADRAVIEKKTESLDRITYTQEIADKIRELDKNRAAFADKIRPLVGDAAVSGVMARLDELVRDVNKKRPPIATGGPATVTP